MTNHTMTEKEKQLRNLDANPSKNVILTKALMRLNPDADIQLKFNGLTEWIESSVEPGKLVLPDGFYYNARDGITNLGNQKGMVYIGLPARLKKN